MQLLDSFMLFAVIIGVIINVYILYYEIKTKYAWMFLVSTSIGILFGMYRIYSISKKL
jgi:hypothetical protein